MKIDERDFNKPPLPKWRAKIARPEYELNMQLFAAG